MKKLLVLLVIAALACMLCACGSTPAGRSDGSGSVNSVSDVLAQQMNSSTAEQPAAEQPASEPAEKSAEPAKVKQESVSANRPIDVDLTKLSSTMVYSEVYNMLSEPQNYIGETVRMGGQFVLYQAYDADGNLAGDQIYYACIVADATACCSQGIEFVPLGNLQYPGDFPEIGSEITVTGEFQTYYEGESMYVHLVNADMVVG